MVKIYLKLQNKFMDGNTHNKILDELFEFAQFVMDKHKKYPYASCYGPLDYLKENPGKITITHGLRQKEALELIKIAEQNKYFPSNLKEFST